MADVQSDQHTQFERVAHQAALQVVPTTHPAMLDTPEVVQTGQPTQIDMATPRAGQAESQGNAGAADPTVVVTWIEERLLGMCTRARRVGRLL